MAPNASSIDGAARAPRSMNSGREALLAQLHELRELCTTPGTDEAVVRKFDLALAEAERLGPARSDQPEGLRRAERLARVQAVTRDLASALTSDRIAQAVIDHAVAAVGARSAAIWIVDEAKTHATMLRSAGVPPAAQERYASLPLDADVPMATALLSGEPVFIESATEFAARFPASARRTNRLPGVVIGGFACVPLVVGNGTVGGLTFAFEGDRSFDDDERAVVTIIADHCAQALYRARSYEAEQRALAEIALLYELVDAVYRAPTVEAVFEAALDGVHRALRVERSSVLLYDDDDVMRFKAWRGLSEAYRRAVEGHSPWTRQTKDPPPIVVADGEADESLAAYRDVFRAERIRALAFFPLVHAGALLGKFMVYDAQPRTFTEDELRVAQTIASEVSQAVARKLSEEKAARLYREAEHARAAAEAASRMKDEFLAVVSHELRSPLSTIAGWTSILQTSLPTDTDRLRKGLAVIERNVKAQTKIIEDILDVSRIITGKLVLDPRPVAMFSIVGDVLDTVRVSAEAKEIELEVHRGNDPYTVVGDPDRLRQIVWNLLSNAIKFTPRKGRVDVFLDRELGSVTLRVRDTGRGIGREFLPYVFERFRQADSSTTRLEGGLGLGLAIVRHLVELHGGHVAAESDGAGAGSTFTLTFPVKSVFQMGDETTDGGESVVADEPTAPSGTVDLRGLRVLIVDDQTDARELLREVLSAHGADVTLADSAEAGIRAATGQTPDLLVSDIGMPDEDGYALVRRIRELPPPLGTIPALALTAYARPDDAARALAAGFQKHLAKPTDPLLLVRTIAALAKKSD